MTTVKFDTIPQGVDVYVDNEKIGTTPLDITNMEVGLHPYTLKNETDTFNGILKVYPGKTVNILVDFNDILKNKNIENIRSLQEACSNPSINLEIPETSKCSNPSINLEIPETSKCSNPSINLEITENQQSQSQTEESPTTPPQTDQIELIKQQLDDMTKTISDKFDENISVMNDLYNTLDLLTQYIGKAYGFDEKESYFTTGQTAIKVATPNVPDVLAIANPNTTPPTPGYDLIHVYDNMNRRGRKIYIHNQGSTDLFVRVSTDGTTYKASETIIYKGAIVTFSNVYDILIRGPKAGNLNTSIGQQPGGIYTISEFPSQFNTYNLNKPAIFVNSIVNVPVQGIGFAFATLIGDIINLPSSFASSVENTDIIYYTYEGADLTFGTRTQLGALAPGDVLIPNGTRGLTIYFAAKSLTGQIIEVTTDTDLA